MSTRRWRLVLLGLLSALALVLFGRWLNATKIGGQQPAEPFRIAGNFYYVGANDVAAFLITGPEGHIDDPDIVLPLRALIRLGIFGYPATRVDHRLKDGDTIRVGPIALTAHVTGGHSRGCTSFSFPVRDGDRVLNVVSACSLVVLQGMRVTRRNGSINSA